MNTRRLALALMAALMAVPAVASGQAPPPNDNYLESLRVNEAGSRLPRATTVRDIQDTTFATEQPDLFAPPQAGGPPEPTQCESSAYGKTIWYDFYPDVSRIARITVNGNGFDPVIGILEFNPDTAVPRFPGTCIDRLAFTNEVLEVPVLRGRAYTVQVGGFNAAGGAVETLFDFLRLPTVDASPTLRARPTSSGIRVASLKIDAPRGARVEVTCTRRACRKQARRASTDFVGYQRLGRLEPGRPQARPTASWSKNGHGGSSVQPRANASRSLTFRN
ncbi:MAG TPA: hypothetical protein VNT60_04400, partial [Deinococcales bacterium]|nr:hypothetical protein [Deinococcales bacterium]